MIRLLTFLLLSSCSMKQWYPTMGAVVGGVPLVSCWANRISIGAGGGALVGEVAKGNAEIEEARETISALTHGDVENLMKGMEQHASGFESFTTTVKRI